MTADRDQSDQASGANANDGEIVGAFVDNKQKVLLGIEAGLAGLLIRGNRPAEPASSDINGHDAARSGVGNI